ncbi:MAG: glucose-6-phosphate isomerase [Armatimonadota bacterium]
MPGAWERYRSYLVADEAQGFSLDISRMEFSEAFLAEMEAPMRSALSAMEALERGAIANPDEGRMVGHYWLRDASLAPTPEIRSEIEQTFAHVRDFARRVHAGEVAPERGGRFRSLLLIGIGGSALGPQLVADALGSVEQPLRPFFLDNTDPDGMDRIFRELGEGLAQTLVVVASKSGGTKETRNGMVETEAAYRRAGLSFSRHAVAITGAGSELDRHAERGGWIARFPMWDWVGGRTSVFSAVGLLPAALLGYDVEALLRGAAEMDRATRRSEIRQNPAALLSLMWYYAGEGRGAKDMVVLPYKDRLGLFAKYLQQLVMESLGKELDLEGRRVNQGIVVYGNKGSTDQHAYVQQLREGAVNFFVTFIQVLQDREGPSIEVQPGATSGDYLHGFLLGTREALAENGRESLTITMERLDAAALGRLIALFDRAVGLYASLIGINAYHQPGVEAGKKAAERVIALQGRVLEALRAGGPRTAPELAAELGEEEQTETVYQVLRHLAANGDRGVRREGGPPPNERFVAG